MTKCRAKGNQGNWFAEVTAPRHPEIDGRSFPCIWDYWWVKGSKSYRDTGYDPTNLRWRPVVQALQIHGLAIMRKRKPPFEEDHWESGGYIAVFRVENVNCDTALTFDIVERICDLSN